MDARFYEPRFKDGKVVALADVALAEGVIVKGFRVVQGERGLFASVPSRPITVKGETRYWNQVTFATSEIRERFLSELVAAYERWEQNGRRGEAVSANGG